MNYVIMWTHGWKTDGDVALGVMPTICHFANGSNKKRSGEDFHFSFTCLTHSLALHQKQVK